MHTGAAAGPAPHPCSHSLEKAYGESYPEVAGSPRTQVSQPPFPAALRGPSANVTLGPEARIGWERVMVWMAIAAAATLSGSSIGSKMPPTNCRGLHGQPVTCSTAQIVLQCRDAKTKRTAKCGAPGSEHVPQVIRHFNG